MTLRFSLLTTFVAAAFMMIPATASAYFVHVIAPGETLYSIAAADGLSLDQLAAANGLSPNAQLVAGETIQIPPQQSSSSPSASSPTASSSSASSSSASSTASSGTTTCDGDNDGDDVGCTSSGSASTGTSSSGGAYVVQPGDTLSAIAARAGVSPRSLAADNGLSVNGILVSGTVLRLSGGGAAGAPASTAVPVSMTTTTSSGSYVVQPGDTLTGIAARAGLSPGSLAAANGLDPNGVLVSGTVLRLSGSAAVSSSAASSQPVGTAAEGSPTDPPFPTPERVTSGQVGSIAAANGVPASLADAIGWQESGFNNDLVSSADARGVMQILPGTWQWIQHSLDTGAPLAPASAADNVRGGVLMLRSLLNSTGGDPAMAAAGYFQGLPSVQQNGLYPETQQYVQNVLALQRQFGGG